MARRYKGIHAWRGSTVSTKVDSYQSEIGADQRSAPTTSRVKLSKAGGSGCGA